MDPETVDETETVDKTPKPTPMKFKFCCNPKGKMEWEQSQKYGSRRNKFSSPHFAEGDIETRRLHQCSKLKVKMLNRKFPGCKAYYEVMTGKVWLPGLGIGGLHLRKRRRYKS